MVSDWHVDHHADLSNATLEMCRCKWPSPFELVRSEAQPTLSLTLTKVRAPKLGRYCDVGRSDFLPLGDVLFQPAGTKLHSRGSGGDLRFLRISFRSDAIDDEIRLAPDHIGPSVQRSLLDVGTPAVLAPLRRIVSELQSPGMASAFLLDGLGLLLAVELARYLAGAAPDPGQARGGLAPWQLRRIAERINDAGAQPPTVAELAALVRLSPRHLARAYRASTNATLSEAVELARQERAEQMVLAGDRPLKEIAYLLGFASPASFSTAFRRRAGCSPQQFARRVH